MRKRRRLHGGEPAEGGEATHTLTWPFAAVVEMRDPTKRLLSCALIRPINHPVLLPVLCILLLLLTPIASFGWSISTNFDGNGIGGVFSGANFRSSPRPSETEWKDYAWRRYQQQQQGVEDRRAREEEKKRQEAIERAQKELQRLEQERKDAEQARKVLAVLKTLHQLQAEEDQISIHDRPIKDKIQEALPEVEAERVLADRDHRNLLARLYASIDKIHVPAPPGRAIPSVLILGAENTPDKALEMQKARTTDPFTGKPFSAVYGFGWSAGPLDLTRATLDHFLLQFGMSRWLPEIYLERVQAQLKGARIGELVVHSNGAVLAEALIRRNMIHPKVLRILGGDGALMNLESLGRLAEANDIELYVYATARDPVPLTPKGWDVRRMVEELRNAPKRWFQNNVDTNSYMYQVVGLRPPSWPPNLHVQLLSAPTNLVNVRDPLQAHHYSIYSGLITGYRLNGCLDALCPHR